VGGHFDNGYNAKGERCLLFLTDKSVKIGKMYKKIRIYMIQNINILDSIMLKKVEILRIKGFPITTVF